MIDESTNRDELPHLTIKRLVRDWHSVGAMMRIYCRNYHGSERGDCGKDGLCAECESLLVYAGERLDQCPYGAGKPTCGKCRGHCFEPERLAQMKRVMCYAGPFMLWEHPIMFLLHWVDSFRGNRKSAVCAKV